MTEEPVVFRNSVMGRIFLLLSIAGLIFCVAGRFTDVYRFKITGAIFEILWLPMLIIIFVIPVVSLLFLFREKFSFRSFYLYSSIVSVLSIVLTVWS